MIKILHFISDTNVGGAGKLLCNQIRNMDGADIKISVALPQNSALIQELLDIKCKTIQYKHGANCSFSIYAIIEAYKIIKRENPDVVHSHGSLSSRVAAFLLKVPSRIITRHCAFPSSPVFALPFAKRIVSAVNNHLSTAFVAVADVVKRNLIDIGCDENKITTVINGAEPIRLLDENEIAFYRAKYGIENKDFVIAIFARLEEYKGHVTLLKTAAIIKKTCPNFRFFIVGDGSQKNKLIELSKELEIDDIVHFTGFVRDVAPIFALTDVNVNCSNSSETASLSLSEGMSLGIPAVASECCGNPYMVKNEVNGLLFPTENADALALCLIRLYCEKDIYQKCSINARKRYNEELNSKKMSKKMKQFYIKQYTTHNKKTKRIKHRVCIF